MWKNIKNLAKAGASGSGSRSRGQRAASSSSGGNSENYFPAGDSENYSPAEETPPMQPPCVESPQSEQMRLIEEEIQQLKQTRVEKIRKFFQLAHNLAVCNAYRYFTDIPSPKSDEEIFKEAKDMEDRVAHENLQPMTLEQKIKFWIEKAEKIAAELAKCHDVVKKIPSSQLRNRK